MTLDMIPDHLPAAPTIAPVPTLDELMALLPALLEDPGTALSDLIARHGPVVRLTADGLPMNVLFVNEPDLVREVLIDADDALVKGRGLQATRILLGDGLLTSEGSHHARHRRLVAPAFHRPRFVGYSEVMAQLAHAHVARWPRREQIDIHACFVDLMLDIVGRTLFGVDLSKEAPAVGEALDEVLTQFSSMTPLGQMMGIVPSADDQARTEAALDRLRDLVLGLVRQRRAEGIDRGDLLSMLVAARDVDGDGTGLTDDEIHDEVMTLLLAGHETTANALSWAVHLLSQHPEDAEVCVAQLCDLVGDSLVTYDAIEHLTILRSVLDETLRLYPPAWAISREASVDTVIGGHAVPEGGQVFVSPWLMHRDGRFWKAPDEFRPQRWLDGSTDVHHRFVFFPFGGGGRSCIGEHFARVEAMIVLAEVVRAVRISPVAGHVVERDHSVTLRPRGGVPVVLHPR